MNAADKLNSKMITALREIQSLDIDAWYRENHKHGKGMRWLVEELQKIAAAALDDYDG